MLAAEPTTTKPTAQPSSVANAPSEPAPLASAPLATLSAPAPAAILVCGRCEQCDVCIRALQWLPRGRHKYHHPVPGHVPVQLPFTRSLHPTKPPTAECPAVSSTEPTATSATKHTAISTTGPTAEPTTEPSAEPASEPSSEPSS